VNESFERQRKKAAAPYANSARVDYRRQYVSVAPRGATPESRLRPDPGERRDTKISSRLFPFLDVYTHILLEAGKNGLR
jgi:hypothetical protein